MGCSPPSWPGRVSSRPCGRTSRAAGWRIPSRRPVGGRERFAARVEAAVYFCAAEAARTAPRLSAIELSWVEADLVLRICGGRPAGSTRRHRRPGGGGRRVTADRELPPDSDHSGRRGCAGVPAKRWRPPRRLRAGPARSGLGEVRRRPAPVMRRPGRRRTSTAAAPRARAPGRQPTGRLDPVDPGEVHVHQHQVGSSSAAIAGTARRSAASPTTTKPSVASTTARIARRNVS